MNFETLKKYLLTVENHISLIIQMGYETTIKSFMNEINTIVYKQ